MFALNPSGTGNGLGGTSGSTGSGSFYQQQLYFFGIQIGFYFVLVRGAYLFFASREESQQALK